MRLLKIIIRVDGNTKIGMGHVYRSLNLAKALKKYNHKIIFLTTTKEARKFLCSQKCILISNNYLRNTRKILTQILPDVIILDKLHDDTRIIKMMYENCNKLIAIDYIGSNKNLIPYGINILYQKSGVRNNNTLSGFEYAVLNNSFARTKPIMIKRDATNILVIQGGSDTHCYIPKIISALKPLNGNLRITVILGPAFRCWKSLKKILRNHNKKIKLLHNVKKISAIMARHDVAITGGGISLLELASLGIPSIVVCGEKFENETANILQKKGFGINLGFGKLVPQRRIATITNALLRDFHLRRRMNNVGKSLINVKGAHKLAQVINDIGNE